VIGLLRRLSSKGRRSACLISGRRSVNRDEVAKEVLLLSYWLAWAAAMTTLTGECR
jgi:hypothetical protein